MVMSLIESLTRIKNAVYGREVREGIHDGVFRANQIADGADAKADNTQIRQDAVEVFNNQVIQEMTDKDVISAPELIEARKGEGKLSTRLDKEHNELTAQLVKTDLKLSDVGINVRDFGVIPNDPNIDNHDSIIAALDYATENDIATLIFPLGETYTSPISLEGYRYIKFKGQSSYNYADYGTSKGNHNETSIRFIGSGEYGIQTAEPVEGGWSARGISFEDITLNGDKNVYHVVNAKYNTVFKNFVARDGIECGIVLENATYPVKLTDTHANFNGKHGIWIRSPFTTVYSIINSEFSRNDGYGMLIEGSAGTSFKNITVQDNKQGGVKINSPDNSTFTNPVYLQTLGFDTLYTEANGQLEPTHPNYEGNWALLITGVGSVRPRKMAFNNSTINQSVTGGAIKVDYGEDIYFDLNTTAGRKIEINKDKTRVDNVRFAPVSYQWQVPSITAYGTGEGRNVLPTLYNPLNMVGHEINGAWIGTRGRTTLYEFFKNDIVQLAEPVSMVTQSGNSTSYHIHDTGSIIGLHFTAKNRSNINGTINIEVQKRILNNPTGWTTVEDDGGVKMKYQWETSQANDLLERNITYNRFKLARGEELRIAIDSEGHSTRTDNNFNVTLLVEY